MRLRLVALVAPVVSACATTSQSATGRQLTFYVSPVADAQASAGTIAIDTTTLRPAAATGRLAPLSVAGGEAATATLVTIRQGGRDHPETIRALVTDSAALARTAAQLARNGLTSQLVIDVGGIEPSDLPAVAELARAVSRAATQAGAVRPWLAVPALDTTAYPTETLARLAEIMMVRAYGEHRPGTAPGALTSSDFVSRAIGVRARVIGTGRLAVELPLFGYLWDREGKTSVITYSEASKLVTSEAGVLRRDQATRFLTATGRTGWTLWVPDASTIRDLLREVTRRGVTRIVLSGPAGADPAISGTLQTIISSR